MPQYIYIFVGISFNHLILSWLQLQVQRIPSKALNGNRLVKLWITGSLWVGVWVVG